MDGPALVNSIMRDCKEFPAVTSLDTFDVYTPPLLLLKLSQCSGLDFYQLRQMTLAHWVRPIFEQEGKPPPERIPFDEYFEGFHVVGKPKRAVDIPRLPWLTRTTLHHVPICRGCLLADEVPYIRLSWKFGLVTSCPVHRLRLVPTEFYTWHHCRVRNPDNFEPKGSVLFIDSCTNQALHAGGMIMPSSVTVSFEWWLCCLRGIIHEFQGACRQVDDPQLPEFYRMLFRSAGYPSSYWTGRSMDFEMGYIENSYIWNLVGTAMHAMLKGEIRPVSGSRLLTLCPPPDPLQPPYCVQAK